MTRRAGIRWTLLGLVVLGGVVRWAIARQDLFADELATYWVVWTHSLVGVVRTVSTTAEISPPLSFVLSWFSTRLGGGPELLRLPALLGGIATIPLVYAVGARTVGRRAALVGAALTTLSPFMIYYSAEARGYGVAMALVLLSTLALLLAIDDGRNRWWVVHGACLCLAAYTHYTVVFVLAVQFLWAFWAYPRCRRSLILATVGAGLLYVPWLPSLKGDFDSPTTRILSDLSPFDFQSVRQFLEHWSLGYPYGGPGRDLTDLPGLPALGLLAVSLGLGVYGIVATRARLRSRLASQRGRTVLVLVLAMATPVGLALQSTFGNHVFGTRNLAASWPYYALAMAALVTAGRPVVRSVAAGLAVVSFGLGAVGMFGTDFRRPQFSSLAHFVNGFPRGSVVDAAPFTPGPLTNFEVEGSTLRDRVFRLGIPEQKEIPFAIGQPRPDPAVIARRASRAAGNGPLVLIARAEGRRAGLAGIPKTDPSIPVVQEFMDSLPRRYTMVGGKVVAGLGADLQAMVFCPRANLDCARS